MNFELLHPADQLIMMMERIYSFGMTTTSGGNLSIMDEKGELYITPGGIDKGSLKREDIVCVHPDGSMDGAHAPSVELPFHRSLYQKRSDIRAIVHAHPPTLVAFSAVRRIPDTTLLPSAQLVCSEVRMAQYDLPGSDKLGEKIAAQFDPGIHAVMLENHGVVVGADSLYRAFMIFETLDFCARVEVNARQIGTPRGLTAGEFQHYIARQHPVLNGFDVWEYSSPERAARRDICAFVSRAYRQQLFTATQGTFSQRLDEESFVITPYDVDRAYLQPEELVTIRQGRCERGKMPSRSVLLHQAIYEKNPDIDAVIVAHAPHILAFAVTGEEFDARLIPESYILLKQVSRIPCGCYFADPDAVADRISAKKPAAIIENDCVITVGKTLLNAFDRLEVMDYSARSIIASRRLGEIVKITPEQVRQIEIAFKL